MSKSMNFFLATLFSGIFLYGTGTLNSIKKGINNKINEYYIEKATEFIPKIDSLTINSFDSLKNSAEKRLNIHFNNISVETFDTFPGYGGFYFYAEDKIKINKNAPFMHKSRKDQNLFDKKFTPMKTLSATILHELGHDYTHQIIDSLEKEGKLHSSFNNTLHYRLVSEGIAESFPIILNELKMPRIKPSIEMYLHNPSLFEFGYMPQVIHPVLKKYGVRKGIEKIFTSEAPNDVLDYPLLKKYQKRLLED